MGSTDSKYHIFDPGFLRGGTYLLSRIIFTENCKKMKDNELRGGTPLQDLLMLP